MLLSVDIFALKESGVVERDSNNLGAILRQTAEFIIMGGGALVKGLWAGILWFEVFSVLISSIWLVDEDVEGAVSMVFISSSEAKS